MRATHLGGKAAIHLLQVRHPAVLDAAADLGRRQHHRQAVNEAALHEQASRTMLKQPNLRCRQLHFNKKKIAKCWQSCDVHQNTSQLPPGIGTTDLQTWHGTLPMAPLDSKILCTQHSCQHSSRVLGRDRVRLACRLLKAGIWSVTSRS